MTRIKQALYLTLGLFFLILGIAGLVLPILNGLIFLILGLILISFTNPKVEYELRKFVRRNATLERLYDKLDEFLSKLFGRTKTPQ